MIWELFYDQTPYAHTSDPFCGQEDDLLMALTGAGLGAAKSHPIPQPQLSGTKAQPLQSLMEDCLKTAESERPSMEQFITRLQFLLHAKDKWFEGDALPICSDTQEAIRL